MGLYMLQGNHSSDFFITANAFQKTRKGNQDGVLLKINPNCNAVVWSTFLGGSADDAAFVLALNPLTQDIYVAGGTSSNDLPGVIPGVNSSVISDHLVGYIDGYVSVVSNDGTTLKRSIYMGTAQADLIYGIQFDRNSFPYVMGVTRASWPVINALYSNPDARQFVVKLKPDLTGIEYSTVFGNGSKPNISTGSVSC